MTTQTEIIMRLVASGQLPDGVGPYLLTLGPDEKPNYDEVFAIVKAVRGEAWAQGFVTGLQVAMLAAGGGV